MSKFKLNTTSIRDFLFFSGFILYLLISFLRGTMVEIDSYLLTNMLYFATTLAIFKILLFDDIFNLKYLTYLFFTFILFLICKNAWNFDIYYFFIFILASKNLEYKKILKVFLITISLSLITVSLLSSFDIIENIRVTRKNLPTIRFALGTIFPTDFAGRVFFLILGYITLKDFNISKIEWINLFLITLITYIFTDTRLVLILMLITLAVLLLKNTIIKIIKKMNIYLINTITVLFNFFIILLGYLYTPSNFIFSKINSLLSGRLALERRAFDDYNITFFGQYIPQRGFGGGQHVTDYFFIDSTIIRVTMMFGIFALITFIITFLFLEHKFIKQRSFSMLIVLILILIYASIDNHLFEISYNFIFLSIFANIDSLKNSQ